MAAYIFTDWAGRVYLLYPIYVYVSMSLHRMLTMIVYWRGRKEKIKRKRGYKILSFQRIPVMQIKAGCFLHSVLILSVFLQKLSLVSGAATKEAEAAQLYLQLSRRLLHSEGDRCRKCISHISLQKCYFWENLEDCGRQDCWAVYLESCMFTMQFKNNEKKALWA